VPNYPSVPAWKKVLLLAHRVVYKSSAKHQKTSRTERSDAVDAFAGWKVGGKDRLPGEAARSEGGMLGKDEFIGSLSNSR